MAGHSTLYSELLLFSEVHLSVILPQADESSCKNAVYLSCTDDSLSGILLGLDTC